MFRALKTLLIRLAQSVLHPARRDQPTSMLRGFARLPIIFDIWTSVRQTRDLMFYRTSHPKGASAHHDDVSAYNAAVTDQKRIVRTRRAEHVYEALAQPKRDMRDERLLIIGPRNGHELFVAWTFGFGWPGIQAIDLYSTSRKIQVMNMEEMSFADETFDALASSSTLAYAQDTKQALSEMARVLKPGGRMAFHAVHDPGAERWPESKRTGVEIATYLRELGMVIYYHSAVSKTNSQGRRQTTHVFAAQKPDPAQPLDDPLLLAPEIVALDATATAMRA